nr:hypothetical protein [uncultured Gellertiella sp.]
MTSRMIALAGALALLAGCTTTGGTPRNALESQWNGKSAGIFFANYGPPLSDSSEGGVTVYSWRGGYKTVHVPAPAAGGKKGKHGPSRTRYLSCAVQLHVDEHYKIRSITAISDRPGVKGPSYCAEFLTDAADQ